METVLIPPASAYFLGIPTIVFSFLIPIAGLVVFSYIITMRGIPLLKAAPDNRWNRFGERFQKLLKIWLFQYRHPRYMLAGVLHITLFAGFLVLSIRSTSLVIIGISENFVFPGLRGPLGLVYNLFKDYAASLVLLSCVIAMIRRGIIKPARYAVPERYGKDHTSEAVFVLCLISTLMISESLFEASAAVAQTQKGLHAEFIAPLSLAWIFKAFLGSASIGVLQKVHLVMYYIHDITFFFFLCFLPMGKHFHVITSIFNVFFMRIDRGNIKPVQHGVSDEQLDDLESFGVKNLADFTWKHMLDFYSCADCGRCSDQCPANAVKRPLSPRFISIKGRDAIFKNYPIYPVGAFAPDKEPLMGSVYQEDEIWSCTTCGACEQECPLGIEYIDKIIDLRRGMVDEGTVPQSLQKPLSALEKRGNPWGKMEKKRADWTKELPEDVQVKVIGKKETAKTLYFADSITSYDDRMQDIGRASAIILKAADEDFGILGKAEKDSGHEVRRFGEEMLFQDLRDKNTEAILASGVERIVTADPHAFNALKNDYDDIPPVEHISQYILRQLTSGNLKLAANGSNGKVYTYHDPCYLGRHNGLYEEPRQVIDAIPGIKRVDMEKCRDRSFCCGGGGLMLFYEPEEEQRMGVLRVEMAAEAGAEVIVTACPFCLVNIEDAIKVAGMEGKMEAIDLAELVAQHMVQAAAPTVSEN
ncbi:MAG: (Fe-S)-binding protein [Desulfobacterales bacterium]|nr:(Fe-S)-binding protein [Desulfobacterales bacterium]MDX2513194.1 (Fe-S)-binding protein [Desulfobacterales bacterium]